MYKVANYLTACIVIKREYSKISIKSTKKNEYKKITHTHTHAHTKPSTTLIHTNSKNMNFKINMCKMDVQTVDETGHIVASVFGLPAKLLLLLSSKQVMKLEQNVLLINLLQI